MYSVFTSGPGASDRLQSARILARVGATGSRLDRKSEVDGIGTRHPDRHVP